MSIKFLNSISRYLVIFSFIFTSHIALAASSPMAVMEQLTNQTLNSLKENQASLHSNPHVVYKIIYHILLPHVDMEEMSKAVLGREVWVNASAGEKQKFIGQF